MPTLNSTYHPTIPTGSANLIDIQIMPTSNSTYHPTIPTGSANLINVRIMPTLNSTYHSTNLTGFANHTRGVSSIFLNLGIPHLDVEHGREKILIDGIFWQ